jgi:hypothetical protein
MIAADSAAEGMDRADLRGIDLGEQILPVRMFLQTIRYRAPDSCPQLARQLVR